MLHLNITPNQGYSPDQVNSPMTLGELKEAVEAAIEEFGEDTEFVTVDTGNRYGAKYGNFDAAGYEMIFEDPTQYEF